MKKEIYLKEKLKYLKLKGGLIEKDDILTKILSIGFEFESGDLFGLLKSNYPSKVRNLNETNRIIKSEIERYENLYNLPQDKLIIQYDNAPANFFNINAKLNIDTCPDQDVGDINTDHHGNYITRPKDVHSKLFINNQYQYNAYTKEALEISNNPAINDISFNIDLINNMTGIRSCEFTYTIRQKDLIEGGNSSHINRDNIIVEGLKEAIDAIYNIFDSDDVSRGIFLGKITNIHKDSDSNDNPCVYTTVTIPDKTNVVNFLRATIYESEEPRVDQPIYITKYNDNFNILFMNAGLYDMSIYTEDQDFTNIETINKFSKQIIDNARFRIQATFSVELNFLFDVMDYLASTGSGDKDFKDDYFEIFQQIITYLKREDTITYNNIISFGTFYGTKYILPLIIIFIYLFITYVVFNNTEQPNNYLKNHRVFMIRNSFDNIFSYIKNKKITSTIETCESCGLCESCKLYENYSYENFIEKILNNQNFKTKLISFMTHFNKRDNNELYDQIIASIINTDLSNEYSDAENVSSRYYNNDIILVEYRSFWADKLFSKNYSYGQDNVNFSQLREKVNNKIRQEDCAIQEYI